MRLINIKKRSVALLYTQFKHSISTNTIYDLTSYRSLIKLKGQDTAKYLQNLITNNVYNLNNENVIYSMILNNRGRILYDILIYANVLNMCIYVVSSSHHIILADCDARASMINGSTHYERSMCLTII